MVDTRGKNEADSMDIDHVISYTIFLSGFGEGADAYVEQTVSDVKNGPESVWTQSESKLKLSNVSNTMNNTIIN